jgi:hypothetical protein
VRDDLAADSAPRWIDVFPWLEAAVASSGNTTAAASAWWQEPVDASGQQRWKRLADVSDLALECLNRWTIGQIFPALRAGTVLAQLFMTNRAKNALARFGYRTAGDLLGLELGELLHLPNVGVGTVDAILQALADASALEPAPAAMPTRHAGEGRAAHLAYNLPSADVQEPQSFIEDLQTVASWYALLGIPGRPLLGAPVAAGSPPEVIKARERLEMVTPSDLIGPGPAAVDAACLLQTCLAGIDERLRLILARRLFADRPARLEELGQDLDLTRERVRQLEARALVQIAEALGPGEALSMVSAAVRELAGTVLPLADLIAMIPALARTVDAVGQPAWRVLDRLDDTFEIKDGWCAAPTILSAQTETMTRVGEVADRHGVARISELGPLNPSSSGELRLASMREWLRYCGCLVDDEHVFTRFQSVGDRAAAILSAAGSPMAAQDILDRFEVERSLTSLKNAMGSDDRFTRVDRDKWALAEWGLQSYRGIRAAISDEVAREDGQIAIDLLIERITGKHPTASASSVATYASAPPFETRNGVVRLAAGDRTVRKGPERTRRMYRRPDCWLYRITVTRDHLRGSGFPAPVAVAAVTGVQPGQTRDLTSALGPQPINWTGSQPAFGSILRYLVDADIETGSEIFLVLGDDGSFRIEAIDSSATDAIGHALRLAGAATAAARQQPRAALAAAIALPEDSPAASVIGGYRDRGDNDIADLLLSVHDQLDSAPAAVRPIEPPDIDDILDLL